MPGPPGLPLEIWGRIAYFADVKTLKKLRLTSRGSSMAATPRLFKEVTPSPFEQNCDKVDNILANENLRRYVNKVTLDVHDWFPVSRDYNHTFVLPSIHKIPRVYLHCSEVFRGMNSEFPNVRNAVIRFSKGFQFGDNDEDYGLQYYEIRSGVMKLFLSWLTSLPRLPVGLRLQNLHNVNSEDTETVLMLQQLLGNLRSMRLGILHEDDNPDGELSLERYDQYHKFARELPSVWLEPVSSILQHLSLYSSVYYGFYPRLDLTNVHLPNLKMLSLGNHIFVHDSQLNFILFHSSTLRELYIDNCAILYAVGIYNKNMCYLATPAGVMDVDPTETYRVKHRATYSQRWHDYFRAFNEGLPHLCYFRVGTNVTWWTELDGIPFGRESGIETQLSSKRYMEFDDDCLPPYVWYWNRYSPGPDDESPPRPNCDPEDFMALRVLLRRIGQRAEGKGVFWDND
ncbi:hypothetical protein AJ79_03284 [Helicocarpus griseus UAMH5409]|uniref:F-box domain-containing protein n=1 Tax=Helicocarpus griseus UAMH5409 TaxID=1447875 RepID=A0A2B7XYJ4_9EURO|nr:hypothetical protein AJ79_03284 [Helicocarpus griseus UAMH5409]